MRVFILCTGRTGSVAIIKASEHIENFTAGHETLSSILGEKRFIYNDNHIEADNRLSWHLGLLYKIYGDEAFYVHLKRDKEKVAQSYYKRFYYYSIIDSFCAGIRQINAEFLNPQQRLKACYDYVDTVNANIEHFLADKPKKMTINIENIDHDFKVFWERIGAKGNLENALKEFETPHNKSTIRKLNLIFRLRVILIREWRHLLMCIKSYVVSFKKTS